VSDRSAPGRPDQDGTWLPSWVSRDNWLLWLAVYVVLMIALAIGTFVFARYVAHGDLVTARELVEQLQAESQKLKRANADQGAQLNTLQGKLATAQATLEAIMPTQNTYNLSPNQSLIVGNGHVTLGLVGSPANENVTLNVNGKQQTAVAGQVISVTPDPSTNCQVSVQSFDMFRALVTASCTTPKSQ
jgi:cell division protein FtsB